MRIERFFKLFRLPVKFIISIHENPGIFILGLNKSFVASHSQYLYQVIKIFIAEGLVTKQRSGRLNKLYLTDKGNQLAEYLIRIRHILNER